jgi:hypothetical protein
MSFVSNNFFNYGANGSVSTRDCGINSPARTSAQMYQGWSSWKNNISGNFDRQLCSKPCSDFKGFNPSTPAWYPKNKVVYPATQVDPACLTQQAVIRGIRREHRKDPSAIWKGPGYYSYMDYSGRRTQGQPLPPVDYTSGWWPGEGANTF